MLVRNNCLVTQSAITALVQSDPDDQHRRTGPSLIGEGAIYRGFRITWNNLDVITDSSNCHGISREIPIPKLAYLVISFL